MQFPWPPPKYTTIADCYSTAVFTNEFQFQIENDRTSPEAIEYIASAEEYYKGKREYSENHPDEYAAFIEKYVIQLDKIDTEIETRINQLRQDPQVVEYNGVMDYFYKAYPAEFESIQTRYSSMYEMAEYLNSPEFYESDFSKKLLQEYTDYMDQRNVRLQELSSWFKSHMYDIRQCEKQVFGDFPREPEMYWV